MLRLSPDELDKALLAIQLHGYGDFFPDPPEILKGAEYVDQLPHNTHEKRRGKA